jgi:hypothetical protein
VHANPQVLTIPRAGAGFALLFRALDAGKEDHFFRGQVSVDDKKNAPARKFLTYY